MTKDIKIKLAKNISELKNYVIRISPVYRRLHEKQELYMSQTEAAFVSQCIMYVLSDLMPKRDALCDVETNVTGSWSTLSNLDINAILCVAETLSPFRDPSSDAEEYIVNNDITS